jgi:hypothetical protein
MPRKMARSGCPTAVRARRTAIAVGTARQLCGRAGKPPVFTPTRVSSGESRLNRHAAPQTINSAENQIRAGQILWPKRGSNDGWQQSWRPM